MNRAECNIQRTKYERREWREIIESARLEIGKNGLRQMRVENGIISMTELIIIGSEEVEIETNNGSLARVIIGVDFGFTEDNLRWRNRCYEDFTVGVFVIVDWSYAERKGEEHYQMRASAGHRRLTEWEISGWDFESILRSVRPLESNLARVELGAKWRTTKWNDCFRRESGHKEFPLVRNCLGGI